MPVIRSGPSWQPPFNSKLNGIESCAEQSTCSATQSGGYCESFSESDIKSAVAFLYRVMFLQAENLLSQLANTLLICNKCA